MKKLYASALLAAAMAMPSFQASANVIEGNQMVQLTAREKSSERNQYRVEVEESVLLGDSLAGIKNGNKWIYDQGSFTIGGWFKLDRTGLGDGSYTKAHIMQYHAREHANHNGSFVISVDENGVIGFAAAGGCSHYNSLLRLNYSEDESVDSTLTRGQGVVEFGKWTNLAFSVNATDSLFQFYQDGKLIVECKYTGTFAWLPDAPAAFEFGANGYTGQIDQLYFLRDHLTASTAVRALRDPGQLSNVAAVYDFTNADEDNHTFAPVAGESTATAAYALMTGSGGGDGVISATVKVVEPELLASTRDADQGYQHYSGASNHARAYPTVRISSAGGYVDLQGRLQGQNVYQDRTDNVINVAPGEQLTVSFPESNTEWMHPYVYVDVDNDGAFQWGWNEDTNTPEGDLLGYYLYCPDETQDPKVYYCSDGTTTTDAHLFFKTLELPFQLPANLESGQTVRVRVKSDWNSIDAYGRIGADNHIANNGGLLLDFMLKIGLPDTVRVAADPVEGGEVYVDVEGVTEAYPSRGANVRLVAKANEDYEFVNWTRGEEIISDEAIVSVPVEGTASYVAHFNRLPERFTVTFTGENVNVKISKDGLPLNSGSRVFINEVITVELETEGAFRANGLTVNGTDRFAEYTENGKLEIPVTEDITIAATAEEVIAHLNIKYVVNGGEGGETAFWIDGAEGDEYVGNGDTLPIGETLYGRFTPVEGFNLVLTINGKNAAELEEEGTLVYEEGSYGLYYYIEAEDVNVEIGYADTAIEFVGADANGAARYFNLQGMEVKAENLTNGVYVVRSADKAEKVYIRK